jgi:antirestriction protein ArdC
MSTAAVVPQHDLYATVTGRIVAALERGAAPWVRPWSQDVDTMPVNAASRRPYRGINALLLALEATSHGYPLNRWLTYRQASELGGQVRRGERGTTVVLWRLRKVAATAETYPEPQDPDLHERVIPLLRAFTVFNLAQVEYVPAPPLTDRATRLRDDPEWLDAAAAYLELRTASEGLSTKLDEAKARLVGLASHAKEQGGGLSVTRMWKRGNVDYKGVPELKGVDLEQYRGAAREETRIIAM